MEPVSPFEKVNVCQTCGDVGFNNAFVYCVKCLEFVIHRYCLNVIPKSFNELVIWYCDHCKPTRQKQDTYKTFKNTYQRRNKKLKNEDAGVNISGTKEGVAAAGHISKNNDGCEGSKTKFTKNTASRIPQDQAKGMTVGASVQDEKVLDKRVNTGKTETETSGVKKGKMEMIDKSKTKKRKGAEKDSNKGLIKEISPMGNEGNPPVKRRKLGKIQSKKKVIEIGSSSKPSKKVKIDEKEDINVDSKAYPPGLRRLSTRMTPGKLSLTMKTLSEVQKEAMKSMGFGSLLGMDIDSIPGKLNYVLLDNYDPTRNRLKVNKDWITITKELVHDIIGLPMGGENIKELESCAYDDPILQEWKAQFPKKLYSAKAYYKLIKGSGEDDIMFRLNFLLTYVYSVKVPVNNLKKGRPFIKYVRASHLDDIENEESKENKLGMGEIEKRCNEDFDTSNTDTDLQALQREFGNIEAYCAIVELGYNKIVSEKMNLEKALNNGLEKFPDNDVLKEWLNKKQRLFNEDDDIMDEDLNEYEEDGDDVGKND
ncbi:hypothetical protein L1887_32373 [Cichorium endivia]|nr:hypothetical protein L1887_32373 [Cichorium endivia]